MLRNWVRAIYSRRPKRFNGVKPSRPAQVVLISGSKFFLEGISEIIESCSDINVAAKISNHTEAETYLSEIKPEFLFLDNTTLDLDMRGILNLVNQKSINTEIILFDQYNKDDKPALRDMKITYITKETDSLELINIMMKNSKNEALS
jgi:Response regulator containing a CheY-like receiver domain and an HTH DNA-binding domain